MLRTRGDTGDSKSQTGDDSGALTELSSEDRRYGGTCQWSRFQQHAISGASSFGGFCALFGLPGLVAETPFFYIRAWKFIRQASRRFGRDPSNPEEQKFLRRLILIGHLPTYSARRQAVQALLEGRRDLGLSVGAMASVVPRTATSFILPALVGHSKAFRLATRMAVSSTGRARLMEAILEAADMAFQGEMSR